MQMLMASPRDRNSPYLKCSTGPLQMPIWDSSLINKPMVTIYMEHGHRATLQCFQYDWPQADPAEQPTQS